MKASFTILGRLPGLNEIVAQARYNRFAGAFQKKKETTRCKWSMLGLAPFTTAVNISFTWIEENAKRDPDNITAGMKFILDAMVELQKIPGDGRKWIKGIEHHFPNPDPKNPRIEIVIEAVGDLVD